VVNRRRRSRKVSTPPTAKLAAMPREVTRKQTKPESESFFAACAEETVRLGRCLGNLVQAGDCLALIGPLGAGKTCFVSGLAEGMDVEGRVASPSFILMRCHPGPVYLYHADAYRLQRAEELDEAGLYEWLEHGVVAIEWAEKVRESLQPDALQIEINYECEGRRLSFTPANPRHQEMLEALRKCAG